MRWRLLAFGLAVYAVALIASAPATLLDARVQRASDGHLRLVEARGTLWSGSAQLEARGATGSGGFVIPLTWQLSARSLLRARLVYGLALGSSPSRSELTLSPSQIEVANLDVTVPAQMLGTAVPKLGVLKLAGELGLQCARLEVGPGRFSGDITMQWRNAGSALTAVSPLGEYELRVLGNGSSVRVTLRTLKGPVQLVGGGAWALGTQPALTATAQIPEADRAQLVPLMQLIAVQRGPGTFELKLP
jgi:general secretion pathway protein N